MKASVGMKRDLEASKSVLRECGFPIPRKKAKLQDTVDRIGAMRSVAEHAAIDHQWTKEDMDIFLSGLSLEECDRWQPHEICLVHELVNTRFVSTEVMAISYYAEMMAKIAEYRHSHLSTVPRLKDQTVTADSLSPLFKLLRKKVEKWDDADGDLLLQYLGNVARVDALQSTASAIDSYCKLLHKLSAFYVRRPDIKAKVDPEIVIFDLSNVGLDLATYIAQLDIYALPPHFGPMPPAVNPGPIGTVFAMPALPAANHFIGWMMGTVPALRATLQPAAPGGVLIY